MKRFSTIVSLLLVSLGVFTYTIKNRVIELETHYQKVQKEIVQLEESIYMLESEWCFLTRPDRLQVLLAQHKKMHALEGFELVSFEDAGKVHDAEDSFSRKIFHASARMR